MDTSLLVQDGIGVTLTIALTQLVKSFIPERFRALVPLVFGVALTFLLSFDKPVMANVLEGLITGLSAAGLYKVGVQTVAGRM